MKEMYCLCLSLLLSVLVTIVTSQSNQACQNASIALFTNPACSNAINSITQATRANRPVTSTGQLNAFCSEDCRALYRQFLTCALSDGSGDSSGDDGDFLRNVDLTLLYCTIDSATGMSCYDVQESPDTAPVSRACLNELIGSGNETTCSPGCAMAVQGFVNSVSCCYLQSLELANQIAGVDILSLILPCRAGNSSTSTCQVIQGNGSEPNNGSNALGGISGSVLLIAAIVVSVF